MSYLSLAAFAGRATLPPSAAINSNPDGLFTTGQPSKHSPRLHFKDSKCRLQFMYGLSDFGVFANFVLQSLEQRMRPCHMLCCFSRSGVWFGFALRLHRRHLFWLNFSPSVDGNAPSL